MIKKSYRNEVRALREICKVIREEVALFGFNKIVDDIFRTVSLCLQHLAGDFCDLIHDGGESLEDFLKNLIRETFEIVVALSQALERRVFQFLELRVDEVQERIDRRESWNRVSLMQLNRSLNVFVRVFLCRSVAFLDEVFVQFVELVG